MLPNCRMTIERNGNVTISAVGESERSHNTSENGCATCRYGRETQVAFSVRGRVVIMPGFTQSNIHGYTLTLELVRCDDIINE
jgi:hypothetical protein